MKARAGGIDRLNALPAPQRPEAAADFIHDASARDLARMAPQDQFWLVRYATALPPESGDKLALIDKVFSAAAIDRDFADREADRLRALGRWLTGEAGMRRVQRDWPKMTDEARHGFLKSVAAKHDELAGVDRAAPIVLLDIPTVDGQVKYGGFDPETGAILINTAPDAHFGDFRAALGTLIHENTHHQQNHLVGLCVKGEIDERHPDHGQLLMFGAAFDPRANTNTLGYDAYRRRPHEAHAFAAEKLLNQALNPLNRLARDLHLRADRPAAPIVTPKPAPDRPAPALPARTAR